VVDHGQLTLLDLTDPATFADGPPHAHFALLRAAAPVAWHPFPTADGPGYWAVTRHDDVMAVERDPATFSSEARFGGCLIDDIGPDGALHLINQDPPGHTRLRRHLHRLFTPRRLDTIEGGLRAAARRIVRDAVARGEFDLVRDVSARLPPVALAELFDLPAGDRPGFYAWVDALLATDPLERLAEPTPESVELFAYVHDLASSRAAEPRDDIVSALVTADVDGDHLGAEVLSMFFLFLAIAGNSTVRSTITGGALALMDHPAEQARLRADRSLVPTAVEEMLRHVSPVNYFRRTATRHCELAGARIAAGDKVTLWYSAANRDERRFVDPDRFDVGRRPNDHIAFGGHGPHFCIGARLARRQVTIVVEELLDHLFPHVEQAGPVRRPPQVHENEIAALPVRVTR
jgi:cholest-4-en-3-one 26-monooxygenase